MDERERREYRLLHYHRLLHSSAYCCSGQALLYWKFQLPVAKGRNRKAPEPPHPAELKRRMGAMTIWCYLLAVGQGFLGAKHQSRVLSCNTVGYGGARGYCSFLPSFLGIPGG